MDSLAKPALRSIQLFEPPLDAVYTIEATAQLVDVPRRVIVHYCKRKLLSSVVDPARNGYRFNQQGIRTLRRIEGLRPLCRDTLGSIKIILDLMDEVQRLQRQILSRSGSANGKSQNETSTDRRTNEYTN